MAETASREFLALQQALKGRYSIERELGRGGMGIVYLAHEVRLDRPVALKLLPPAFAVHAPLRERFLREARTAAKLSHPHIVPIFAVDEVEDSVFFAMAHIDGETLGQRIRQRGPFVPSDAARVLREVAWALAYAHAQGVTHRDVKPDNILLEAGSGRALVTDFGIAQIRTEPGLTGQGELVGTAEFMSPEQASGEAVDGRSDLYSLGVVGFYALTGRLPFEAPTVSGLLAKHITQPPPGVVALAPETPRRVAQVIDRCLLKDPARRYGSGEEVAEALARSLEVQRELPVPLRVFLKHNRESVRTTWAAVLLVDLMLLPSFIVSVSQGAVGTMLALGGVMAALAAGPFAVMGHMARRLLRAGYAHDEAVAALKTDLERRREELAFEYGRRPKLVERVARVTAFVGLAGFVGGLLLLLGGSTGDVFRPTSNVGEWLMTISAVGGGGAGLVAARLHERRRDLVGERRLKQWKGRLGRWLFRVARIGLKPRAAGAPTHRPTELALGLAADRLFDDLPKDVRRGLRDLPDVVRKLETDAQRMRRRVDELNGILTDIGADTGDGPGTAAGRPGVADERQALARDVRAARDAAQQRLTDAVAALETIRLDLLRLHAGAGSVESVTADLAAARSLSDEIERLLRGREEVERFLAEGGTAA